MVTEIKYEMPTLREVLEDGGGNEDLLGELLCKFRLWLKQQAHLPQDVSDQRLKYFIFAGKFNLEKAKRNLDMLYTLHNLISDTYGGLDPLNDDVKLYFTCYQSFPLPKLTPEKYRLHISRIIDYDLKCDMSILLRVHFMSLEVLIEEDIVANHIIIWDCNNTTLNHVMMFTPSALKKLDSCLTAYSFRIKAIHLINAPSFVDIAMKVAKSVMKVKLFSRIHVHTSGIESLYKTIPKSILPLDYGGEELSADVLADMWLAKLIQRKDFLLKEGNRKAIESLRSKDSVINPDNLFGVSGTFRQLQID